jgi:hypothetical protein
MIKKIFIVMMLFSVLIVYSAETKSGGYSKADLNDEDVLNVYSFIVKNFPISDLEIIKPVSVQKQVVAGLNYKFIIALKDSSGKKFNIEVVVYENLQKLKKITSIINLKTKKEMSYK